MKILYSTSAVEADVDNLRVGLHVELGGLDQQTADDLVEVTLTASVV